MDGGEFPLGGSPGRVGSGRCDDTDGEHDESLKG
jgi:hypothetical protein